MKYYYLEGCCLILLEYVPHDTFKKKSCRLIFVCTIFQGGFAKCYEIRESKSHRTFAGKIVPKSQITKSNHREKMTQEISIHQTLNHKNVVGFYGFFDDPHNVYIILELCRKRVNDPYDFSMSFLK